MIKFGRKNELGVEDFWEIEWHFCATNKHKISKAKIVNHTIPKSNNNKFCNEWHVNLNSVKLSIRILNALCYSAQIVFHASK